MIIFHSLQSGCGRRVRKKSTRWHTSNSRHELHRQIGALMFTKREKDSATIFKEQCKRTSWNCFFMQNKPYPLSKQGFYGSPIARRNLRGVPRDERATGANHPARNPAKCLAPYPRNVPAMVGQWQQQCRRMVGRMTCKTTCLAPDLAATCPAPETCETTHQNLIVNHDTKNYEYANHTNARS
jgi:hypothetical protein